MKFKKTASMLSLFTLALLGFTLNAHAIQPHIDYTNPSQINAGDINNFEVFLYGRGMAPAYSLTDNQKDVEVGFKVVGQDMSSWGKASNNSQNLWDPNAVPSISMLGDGVIKLELPVWMIQKPAKIEFTVCVRTVGCSNIATVNVVNVSGDSGKVTILDSNALDAVAPDPIPGYVATLKVNVSGLTGYAPSMKINGMLSEGTAHPQQNQAWFYLDSKIIPGPGLYSATIVDSNAGESTNNILIRAFKKPQVTNTNPQEIKEGSLFSPGATDTSVEFSFAAFTYPSQVVVVDSNGTAHTLNPPIDLLTNKLKVAIPAAWLKIGDSQLGFTFSNIAGSATATVPVHVILATTEPRRQPPIPHIPPR